MIPLLTNQLVNIKLLEVMKVRRRLFDDYTKEKNINIFTCPCCGYPTIKVRGGSFWCKICSWEDDCQDDLDADDVKGGPNGTYSLTEARIDFQSYLEKRANILNGEINLNCDEVFQLINERDKKIEAFKKNEPPGLSIDHPYNIEYRNFRKQTLDMLIKN